MKVLARYKWASQLVHTLLALPPVVQAYAVACEACLEDFALLDVVVDVLGAEAQQ